MKKKINKKRLNVLKAKNNLNNLMYFSLETRKALKQETLLKSTTKTLFSTFSFFNYNKLKFPIGIRIFESTNDTVLSIPEDKNPRSITALRIKSNFLTTTKDLYLIHDFNTFDNFIYSLNEAFLLLKLLNYQSNIISGNIVLHPLNRNTTNSKK